MAKNVDLDYCYRACPRGKAANAEFLEKNNSAYDAVCDFWAFTDECFKTCPYKDKHIKEKS